MTTEADGQCGESCVLVVLPTGRDAKLVSATLEEAGVEVEVCPSVGELVIRARHGAGAIVIAEEAIRHDNLAVLANIIKGQPVWSDLPVILLSSSAASSERLSAFVGNVLNITIIDRPLQKAVLISAVREPCGRANGNIKRATCSKSLRKPTGRRTSS